MAQRPHKKKAVAPYEKENDSHSGWSDYLCGFFYTATKKKTPTVLMELRAALSRYSDQVDNESAELDEINLALREIFQEIDLTCQAQIDDPLPVSIEQDANEATALVEPSDRGHCNHLLRELNELMHTYPVSSFRDTPTVEGINAHADASKEHHEKVLSIAEILLSNLSSKLREIRVKEAMILSLEEIIRQRRF